MTEYIERRSRAMAHATRDTHDSAKRLQALLTRNPAIHRAKLIASKGELVLGTCDWIAQRKEFIDWRASKGGLLWICGGPGLGKTMLSVYLTEYLSTWFGEFQDAKSYYSTYFFCDAKDNARNNAVAILRGMLLQLLEQQKQWIPDDLLDCGYAESRLPWSNSLEGLWEMFVQSVNGLGDSHVTCVIDGLDECEPASLESLLTKMNEISRTAPRLGMIILSQDDPRCIGTTLSQFSRIRLDPDAKTGGGDGLQQYISKRIAELAESRQYPAEIAVRVKKALREKCAGTFLWVSLVVKDLQAMHWSDVEGSLDQIPHGLDALYARILNQVKPARRDMALRILRWCAFAVRPLSLKELASALAIESTELLDRETILREHIAHCGHLLSTANDAVTLVHQSAHRFLTSRDPRSTEAPWFSLSQVELEHSNLASACISYFSRGCSEGKKILGLGYHDGKEDEQSLQDPFFRYAGLQWEHHYERSGLNGYCIMRVHPQFFSDESQSWWAWAKWRIGKEDKYHGDLRMATIAAHLGLAVLMRHLLTKKMVRPLVRGVGRKTTILHIATKRGHVPIIQLLVKSKWLVNTLDHQRKTPLYIAYENEDVPAAKLLIEHGARINDKYMCRRTLLHHAALLGKLAFVKLLAEHGADMEKTLDGQTALAYAVFMNHWETARVLLMHGAKVDGGRESGRPLLEAIKWEHGSPKLVKLLLDWGADSRTRTRRGSPSRLGCLLDNKTKSLGTLLEHWAKEFCTEPLKFRDRVDFGHTTALHVACRNVDLPAIRLLLDPKWNLRLNQQDRRCLDTPLHVATKFAKIEVLDLLLAQPSVNFRMRNARGHSPMHLAVLCIWPDAIQRLVAHGGTSLLEPDAEGGWGAMHVIISDCEWFGSRKECVRMLFFLEKRYRIDPRGRTLGAEHPDRGRHACHRRSSSGDKVRPLCNETPLSIAIRHNLKEVVEYLIAHCRVDPREPCRGCDGASPLHVAAQSLREDMVDLLVSAQGVDVNAVDDYQRTPLHLVAGPLPGDSKIGRQEDGVSREKIIQLLLKAGAHMTARDVNGRTPQDLFVSSDSRRGLVGIFRRERKLKYTSHQANVKGCM
ncbi:hypothetical protein A9Z42_0058910 [Trichoderma parareesei]|uniref:Uncharacterized protein n=1 Tax=Trichoderma parareesei TaxID=858221 RepID=A0A2H2ZHJ2_TRIPA|nr:hypothetical protein A9Z42_0058910 [Trichoderma parareesei]